MGKLTEKYKVQKEYENLFKESFLQMIVRELKVFFTKLKNK